MSAISSRLFNSSATRSLVQGEWGTFLPLGAIVLAFFATHDDHTWLRTLTLINIAALLAFTYWRWMLRSCQRLGDVMPSPQELTRRQLGLGGSDENTPSGVSLQFEDLVNDAVLVSTQYSRHAGLISLCWSPDAEAVVTADVEPLRRALKEALGVDGALLCVDDDRAWALAPMLRGYDDLVALQNKLVSELWRTAKPPLQIAAGCAMAPMHGYDASSLMDFAEGRQQPQGRCA